MLWLWIAIAGGVQTVLNAIAIIWKKYEKPIAFICMAIGLVAIFGGAWLHWHESTRWKLTNVQRESLRKEACGLLNKFYLPIFWAPADSNSQSFAEDIFGVFVSCGWPTVMDSRAWVGPNVLGMSINTIASTQQTSKNLSELKQLFDRAKLRVGDGSEMRGDLMPSGVAIKVGSRPSK